jgi:hypothetical protein
MSIFGKLFKSAGGSTKGTDERHFIFNSGTITDYLGHATNIVIPDFIHGEKVISIGNNAFRERELTMVSLPKYLLSIGDYAFSLNNLEEISLPDALESIGMAGFSNNKLSIISLPDHLKVIELAAFYNNLCESVFIPKNVERIDANAFVNPRLAQYEVDALNDHFSSLDGVLYSKDKKNLVSYPSAKNVENFTIPDSVTKIQRYAFNNTSIKSIVIPNSVREIGESCFLGCELRNITIGDDVATSYFGKSAFPDNFGEYYKAKNSMAGCYFRDGEKWNSSLDDISDTANDTYINSNNQVSQKNFDGGWYNLDISPSGMFKIERVFFFKNENFLLLAKTNGRLTNIEKGTFNVVVSSIDFNVNAAGSIEQIGDLDIKNMTICNKLLDKTGSDETLWQCVDSKFNWSYTFMQNNKLKIKGDIFELIK